MTDDERPWIKPPEVADRLGVSVIRVQRWLAAGKFRTARKIGGLWFVHRSELEPEYDAEREGPSGGIPVPAAPRSPLGGDGHNDRRQAPEPELLASGPSGQRA